MDVLEEISAWASSAYRQGRLLSGIIYLHNISRKSNWDTRDIKIFHNLCGLRALQNVLLTTTKWSNVNQREGERREEILQDYELWGGLINKGTTVRRFMGTRESGLELIDQLMKKEPIPLLIQRQIVDENMALEETDAGQCID